MTRMTITREKRANAADWDVIKLAGVMTEEAGVQLLRLYDDAGKKCIFHMGGVTAINSNGVRAWMIFIRDFRQEREIELEECSPAVVAQMNMLASFTQKVRVKSVIVAFHCGSCQKQTEVLVPERDFPKNGDEMKGVRCKSCGSVTEPAEEGYFDFASLKG